MTDVVQAQEELNNNGLFELKSTPSGDVHAARTEPELRPLATGLVITSEKGSTCLSRHPLAMRTVTGGLWIHQ